MPSPATVVPIFDGHNDVLLRLHMRGGEDPVKAFLDGENKGQLDLPMARAGGFAGGLFAIFVPNTKASAPASAPSQPAAADAAAPKADATVPPAAITAPGGVDLTTAQQAVYAMSALLFRIERASAGRVKVCRTVDEIEHCMQSGILAPVLHIEGAEAIDLDFAVLDVLHQAGLRSIGPVWSRSNAFGHGVPFRFPSSPDIGPGLTEAGKALVRACNRLRMLIDLSHLNEQGFWDVAALSDAPLVATHSNAHVLCTHSRNLTDKQLAAIKDSRGMVGVNFAVAFLRPDGRPDGSTPLELIIDHLEHLLKHLGEDGVGFGSDFDGAKIPDALGSAAGLQGLVEIMRKRGYGEPLIRKLCFENWLGVLRRTWER